MIIEGLVLPYNGVLPMIGRDVFLAPGSSVIGDVDLGSEASVWFGSVIRGDVNRIRIGSTTNIQDGSILHVSGDALLTVGEAVTVGHGAVLHGCTIGAGALIGIGARVLDHATVGDGAMVAAGALVTPGTEIPPGTLALGSPARVVRSLREEEKRRLRETAGRYVVYAATYRAEIARAREGRP